MASGRVVWHQGGWFGVADGALWSGTTKNRDVSAAPLACPFARLLTPLTHALALPCSLHLCASLLIRSLASSLNPELMRK